MPYHTTYVEQKVKSFGRAAITLAVIGMIAKFIGALYRVPLTNTVGAEGMGLYQMVFPLYTVLLAFCGGGMTSAVSRVVAKYTALDNESAAHRTLKVAIVPLAIISVMCAVGVAIFRNVISGVQGNTDAAPAYLALCPSLLFTGGISVLRGYFQGKSNMLPSGISQLVEQIIKLVFGLYLSEALLPHGVKYAVAGALIGVTAGEFIALAYLATRFAVAAKKRVRYIEVGTLCTETAAEFALSLPVSDKTLLKELYTFALSVTLGAMVLPITQMIDSVLVINLLMYGGASKADATAMFGLFVGPVGTLINMPTVIVFSVAIAFLPTITRDVERGIDGGDAMRSAAKWIMLLVIPITAVFMIFPSDICRALYSKGLTAVQLVTAAQLLRVQALSVFYLGILQLATAVLQGYNKAHRPVINLVIGACVKVGITPLAVRAFGIIGAGGATVACYAIAAVLSVCSAYKCKPFAVNAADAVIKPALFTAIGCATYFAVFTALAGVSLSFIGKAVISATIFACVYIAGILLSDAAEVKKLFSKTRVRRQDKKNDGNIGMR